MKNQYETVFILTPVLSEAQMKEAVQKFKDFLAEKKAEMVHEEHWGLKKLAIPSRKNQPGSIIFLNLLPKANLFRNLSWNSKGTNVLCVF